MAPLLEIERLTQRFGGVVALDAVSMAIEPGQLVALIGPNGAGKTTLFNCITGLLRPGSGLIRFGRESPEPLIGLPPHTIARRGIARTFQNIRLFAGMSALENVSVGTYCRTRAGLFSACRLSPSTASEERWTRERAMELLSFVGLAERAGETSGALPFGLQRRLELARALASDPALLLLDEPAAGLNPVEKQELLRLIESLRSRGLTLLIIEHDMRFVMPISERVVVLDYGKKIAEGPPSEVQSDPRVIEAYLGASPVGLP